ncbi:MAG: hypothetical protein HRU70_09990 [Phycisphaeraceae bacterium]|nr:MAG: hypothetical protein HRU70_09990 [Phycisphaeraceae bacterium]
MRRTALVWAAWTSAVVIVSGPALAFAEPQPAETTATPPASRTTPSGEYAPPAGPFKVGQKDLSIKKHDGGELELRVRWPQRPDGHEGPWGPWPVVVFSHGAGGSRDAFGDVSAAWASRGYVVVHPTHSDSVRLRRERGERLTGAQDVVRNVRPIERCDDVRLILDSLGEVERAIGGPAGEGGARWIDTSKVGMAGHSAGAMTTQLLGGVTARLGGIGRARSYAEPRIKAFAVISGQGTTTRMFTEDSWKGVSKPMIVYAGSLDVSPTTQETPQSRRHPYELAPPGDKYLVYIEGATHASYGGKETSRLLAEKPTTDVGVIVRVVESGTLAFWDAYLKGDAGAKAYLASESLVKAGEGKVEFLRK